MNAALLFLLALSRSFGNGVLRCTFDRVPAGIADMFATAIMWPKPRTMGNLVGRCKACRAGMCITDAVACTVKMGSPGGGELTTDGAVSADAILLRSLSGTGYTARCTCGGKVLLRAVEGVHSAHVCNAKCMGSTGPACECSCGGKNHGRAFA